MTHQELIARPAAFCKVQSLASSFAPLPHIHFFNSASLLGLARPRSQRLSLEVPSIPIESREAKNFPHRDYVSRVSAARFKKGMVTEKGT